MMMPINGSQPKFWEQVGVCRGISLISYTYFTSRSLSSDFWTVRLSGNATDDECSLATVRIASQVIIRG